MGIFKNGTVTPTAPSPSGNDLPWMAWMKARDGWTEFNHDKELSAYWKYSGLDYTTVIGADHAWCALTINGALHDSGLKGTGSAAAASFQNFGDSCGYVYGAILPIRHVSGAHHVTCFDHWVDEKAKVAACRGGNQHDGLNVSFYNLSGNANGHEEVVTGPRWPKGYPKT